MLLVLVLMLLVLMLLPMLLLMMLLMLLLLGLRRAQACSEAAPATARTREVYVVTRSVLARQGMRMYYICARASAYTYQCARSSAGMPSPSTRPNAWAARCEAPRARPSPHRT